MTAEILDGKAIARRMREAIPKQLEEIRAKGKSPHLVSIQVGDDPASSVFVNHQKRSFEASGIPYTLRRFGKGMSEEELAGRVEEVDRDPTVTGIILQLPLPEGIRPSTIYSRIRPEKDVEGMNPSNLGYLVQERPIIAPCTAAAVYEMIRSCTGTLRGKEAVVVGHSPLVGKPTSMLLLNDLATVTVCHIGTEDLASHTRRAEILVTAAGVPGLIRGSMIRPGAIVIDVGTSLAEDSQGRSVGDVVFEEALAVAGYVSPVPGGVGPVTIAVLMRNTIGMGTVTFL